MSQCANIIKSFKDRVSATAALNAALSGDLHQGSRVDTTIGRPYGLIDVKEISREGHSGNAWFVKYEAELKIVGEQSVGDVGAAQTAFAAAFNLTQDLPSVVGAVILVVPLVCSLDEDPDQEFSRDIIVGLQTWEIVIQESI